MKYASGEAVLIGDTVELAPGDEGCIVGIIERHEYLPGYAAEDWDYLTRGCLILSPLTGLFHYVELGDEIFLKRRRHG